MSNQQRKAVEVDKSLRNCCEKFEKGVKRILPLILLIIYTIFGGFIFHLIEEPNEIRTRKEHSRNLTNLRNEMRHRLSYITANYPLGHERDEKFNEELVWYHEAMGVTEDSGEPKWNFWGAMFYAMTLYTTIGYGNIYPGTDAGRVMTIFYSLFGIPLALAAVVQLGMIVAYIVITCWRCCTKIGRKPMPRGKQQWQALQMEKSLEEAQGDIDLLNLPVSLLCFVTVVWTLGIAGLFLIWEPWDYFTSLYFTIISFSTIGLGDVVPTKQKLLMLVIIFVLIGLALLSTLFAVIQSQIEALQNSLKRKMDQEYQNAQAAMGEVNLPMTDDDRQIDSEMRRMTSELPLSSRFLYWAMSDNSKKKLKKYWRAKAGLQSRGTQTDERWMRSSYLERIGEEEDRRSHDDVNSLVALCDYALH